MSSYISESKRGGRSKKTRVKRESDNGDLFIAPRMGKPMLSIALGRPPKLPVCRQGAPTHAAGSATAGLAVRIAKAQTMVLYDLTDIWCGELYLESNFTDSKVLEHAAFLDLLLQMMTWFGMQEKQNGRNILNDILRMLPRGSLRQYWDNTNLIWKTLNEICDHIHGLMLPTREFSDGERSEQIRLLLEKVVRWLRETRARLKEMTECLDVVTEHIRADWDKDVRQISQGHTDMIP